MTTVSQYIAISNDSTKWGLEDPAIAGALADKAGITADDITALRAFLPRLEAAWNAAQSVSGPQAQATQDFLAALDGVKTDLSDLRKTMKNNLPANDPLFVTLGLKDPQPAAQDDLLAYAVRAFSNAQALTAGQLAPLVKRKWDAARLAAALDRARAAQALNDAQESAKASAKAATDQLYNLIDEFDALFRPYTKEARRVLAAVTGALDKMQLAAGIPDKPARPAYRPRPAKAVKPVA
jgi:hypothetical protein